MEEINNNQLPKSGRTGSCGGYRGGSTETKSHSTTRTTDDNKLHAMQIEYK